MWEHLERLEPVAEVVPHYDELVPDLSSGTPIVLTDGGTRIAVIVAWDMWTLQHERYLNAAALSWAHWRTGRFDAAAFGWDVIGLLRPPCNSRCTRSCTLARTAGPMSVPVDPLHRAGRWLVTTASGAMHLIESTGPNGTVTATRITSGPAGGDPRYPLGALRRDDQAVHVTGVQHRVGVTMANGFVIGEDMWLYLEPLDPAADLTVRRTTPVVTVDELPGADAPG